MAHRLQLGLAAAPFLFIGCANMPPYEALFDSSPEAIGTGIAGVGLVRAFVIVAKYQATERQRQVAEQNARRAYQKIVAQQNVIKRPRNSATNEPVRRPVHARKLIVSVPPDTRSTGRESVMIFDTVERQLISNVVYDLKESPRILERGRLGNIEGEYVDGGGVVQSQPFHH